MFKFKQFSIHDGKSAMKIGTDGILLGCWADVSFSNRILDIGTGTGVIAIMCAQKNQNAQIQAIEIDDLAFEDATHNVVSSPWKDRIEVIHQDFKNYQTIDKVDAMISNPPFFENSMRASGKSRNTARHTDTLHYSDLFKFAQSHLSSKGKLSIILPIEYGKLAYELAPTYGLQTHRICEVRPVPQKPPHRWLLEFSKEAISVTYFEELTIENGIKRHEYTEEYIRLCKEFYLYF